MWLVVAYWGNMGTICKRHFKGMFLKKIIFNFHSFFFENQHILRNVLMSNRRWAITWGNDNSFHYISFPIAIYETNLLNVTRQLSQQVDLVRKNTHIYFLKPQLTHWSLVTIYGDRDLGQHWLRYWLVAWRHQAITWTNVDLLSITSSGIHLRAIS